MNGKNSQLTGVIAGVLTAILLFLSVAVVDPLRDATDAELVDWWSSSTNLDNLVASMYTRLLAVPFLLAFLGALRSVLRTSDKGSWPDFVQSTGIVAAAVLAVSAVARGVTAQAIRLDDEPVPGVDTLRLVTELSYQGFSIAFVGMLAVTVAVTGIIVLRTGALPKWLGWLSLPVALVSLAAAAAQMGAFASPLLIIWILATSFCLARVNSQASTAEESSVPRSAPQLG